MDRRRRGAEYNYTTNRTATAAVGSILVPDHWLERDTELTLLGVSASGCVCVVQNRIHFKAVFDHLIHLEMVER